MRFRILNRTTADKPPFREALLKLFETPGEELVLGYGYMSTEATVDDSEFITSIEKGFKGVEKPKITIIGKHHSNKNSNTATYIDTAKNIEKSIVGSTVKVLLVSDDNYHKKIAIKYIIDKDGDKIPQACIIGSSNLSKATFAVGYTDYNQELDILFWNKSYDKQFIKTLQEYIDEANSIIELIKLKETDIIEICIENEIQGIEEIIGYKYNVDFTYSQYEIEKYYDIINTIDEEVSKENLDLEIQISINKILQDMRKLVDELKYYFEEIDNYNIKIKFSVDYGIYYFLKDINEDIVSKKQVGQVYPSMYSDVPVDKLLSEYDNIIKYMKLDDKYKDQVEMFLRLNSRSEIVRFLNETFIKDNWLFVHLNSKSEKDGERIKDKLLGLINEEM